MAYNITINFGAGHSIGLEVNPQMTIKHVKQQIYEAGSSDADEDLSLILQGKELHNTTVLKECDLGAESSLFAVRKMKNESPISEYVSLEYPLLADNKDGLNNIAELDGDGPTGIITNNGSNPGKLPAKVNHFYIYCQAECNGIQCGKARVRCGKCKDGVFTLTQNPRCWEDVLTPGRIRGNCHIESCNGNIAEIYFKCSHHDGEAVAMDLIRTNQFDIPCAACMDIRTPVLVFDCDAGHSLCMECFQSYVTIKLEDRSFVLHNDYGYTVQCPASCENSHIKNTHHFYILGKDKYELYKRFGTEEFVLQNAGVICPTPGCEAALLLSDNVRDIVCQYGCKRSFCRACRELSHAGDCTNQDEVTPSSSLTMNASQIEQSRWDRMSRVTICETTKPCPKCRVPTEKADGCMHMTCSRCTYDWCWCCHDQWTNDCMSDHWFTQ